MQPLVSSRGFICLLGQKMETEKLDLGIPLPVDKNVRKETNFANKVLSGRKKLDDEGKESEALIELDKLLAKPKIEPVTEEYMASIAPPKMSKKGIAAATEMMNKAIEGMDDGLGVHFRDQCIDLISCLKGESPQSLQQYYNAVKFLVHRMAGDSLIRAYSKTFPDRVAELQASGTPESFLYSYASIYNKTKLVVELQGRMLVPSHIMYHDYFHLAVKTQVEIMTDKSVSPKVRSDAANSLMTHLKAPEVAKAELEVKVEDNSIVDQLKTALTSLASQQKRLIDLGEADVEDVSKQVIYKEVEDGISQD